MSHRGEVPLQGTVLHVLTVHRYANPFCDSLKSLPGGGRGRHEVDIGNKYGRSLKNAITISSHPSYSSRQEQACHRIKWMVGLDRQLYSSGKSPKEQAVHACMQFVFGNTSTASWCAADHLLINGKRCSRMQQMHQKEGKKAFLHNSCKAKLGILKSISAL